MHFVSHWHVLAHVFALCFHLLGFAAMYIMSQFQLSFIDMCLAHSMVECQILASATIMNKSGRAASQCLQFGLFPPTQSSSLSSAKV